MNSISETDLILNEDGSVYHLNLLPGDIADTVITVGDQDRVAAISRLFDHIELKKGKREFITHTGRIGSKRITVISTGIGTDNIDIVFNELDALVNIDLHTRIAHQELRSLDIIRIGTSGAIQADIPVDSLLVSSGAFGLDPLMHYYEHNNTTVEQQLLTGLKAALPDAYQITPYFAGAGSELMQKLGQDINTGITVTAPGFYAPQGREVRFKSATPNLMEIIQNFNVNGKRITNLEMETAGIYGLASALGHQALSFSVILANRATKTFSSQPTQIMNTFIEQILEKIVDL